MSETNEREKGLRRLQEPFEPHLISRLPKPTVKKEEYDKLQKGKCSECGGYHATSKTIHLSYVGHAALTSRLLEVDPLWSWEPLAYDEQGLPRFDNSGGLWIKLTVLGVTRLGYGNAKLNTYADIGSREKEVIGDALRNAAMRFGCALDLWHKGELHPEVDEKSPTIGVKAGTFETMSEEQQKKLRLIADKMEEYVAESRLADAAMMREQNNLDADEKVALSTLLDSPTRTALEKYRQEKSKRSIQAQQKNDAVARSE